MVGGLAATSQSVLAIGIDLGKGALGSEIGPQALCRTLPARFEERFLDGQVVRAGVFEFFLAANRLR